MFNYCQATFDGARIFNNDVSSWDVSYVYSMDQMFNNAEKYEQKMCEWNLEGKEVGILCLRTVNAQNFNVQTVPPSYYQFMFRDAAKYEQKIFEWNLKGKNVQGMFTNS